MYKNDFTFSSKCITVNYQYHFSIILNSYNGLLHYYVKMNNDKMNYKDKDQSTTILTKSYYTKNPLF